MIQNWEAKIGTATLAVNLMAMSLFILIPNKTHIYIEIAQIGLTYWMGLSILIAGALSLYGALCPRRKVRHFGQFMAFIIGWWQMIVFLPLDIVPSAPLSIWICGFGLFLIWVRDVFAGVTHRNQERTGVYHGLQYNR